MNALQIDIVGQQIWEYTHQCDHAELREALNKRNVGSDNPKVHRNLLLRIKCTLTSRGRSVNIKSASYKVRNQVLAEFLLLLVRVRPFPRIVEI